MPASASLSHTEVAPSVPRLPKLTSSPPPAARSSNEDAADRERTAHASFLHGRYGDDWHELPATLGRRLANAEELLALGPVTIRPTTSPAETIRTVRVAVGAAAALGDIARNESEILENALGARLTDLPLSRLSALAAAILGLASAPTAEPAWAWPAAAHAAEAVLDAYGDEFRTAARAHHAVYSHFAEDIWNVPLRWLTTGRRLWRPLARRRLRRSLATSSRTHVAPKPFAATVGLILEARAASRALSAVAPLLAHHLGTHDRGPLTDVDTAQASLVAVRALHVALGDRLDAARIARLLAADAFKDDAVLEPARNLATALHAWTSDVARAGGGPAFDMSATDLTDWVSLVDEALPDIERAIAAIDRRDGATTTMRDLVYDLLVRERFADLSPRASDETIAASRAGAAS